MAWFTRFVTRSLQAASQRLASSGPEHLVTARWGETEAYFYLRSLGYRIVARNFRTPNEHGEIDMIGWDDGVLCFIEVKTLTKVTLAPPELAVDAEKKKNIRSVARRYVRRLRTDRSPSCRFDVVSVILGDDRLGPKIRVHKGAFAWEEARRKDREYHRETGPGPWWRK